MATSTSRNQITVISATVLVAVELLVAGVAAGWALAGMLGLGEVGAWIFEGIGALIALYLIVMFHRTAVRNSTPRAR
ncbi:hypothetical protein [Terrihabitans rhizophilus]|uniref:Uncharacterized protein n=1 Tax=Terrihabitans rhizophilus TaxID=3092662 RepID=A0ABU4RQP4_9HYPH|nr:hypothetical protein [Terrihabitans sp. PJ23]MDX6807184.1 hypothetical protein [Terrihabitans sp. PJ23]